MKFFCCQVVDETEEKERQREGRREKLSKLRVRHSPRLLENLLSRTTMVRYEKRTHVKNLNKTRGYRFSEKKM